MTELERKELTDRVLAMSEDEKILTVSLMPTELLFEQLYQNYWNMNNRLNQISEVLQ